MKVLIIINKVGLGDCIIHVNYIHEISKKYGKPISILAKGNTRAKDLFLDDPHISEVITLDRLNDNTGYHDGINGFFRLAKDIKEKKFDKVFIFNSSIRYFLICKIAGIKKIAQYPLFKKKGQHVVNTAKIFTENELSKIVSTQPKLLISEEKILKAKKEISQDHKNIVLGVSASGPTKRWEIKNFIKLIEKIIEKYSNEYISKNLASRIYINGRKSLIQRCINNLIDNAIKYGDKINIELSKNNNNLFIKIEDNGPGIPQKEYDNVFKPFYKIDKGRADSKSSVGLGLSIASDIIRSHGGNIKLEKSSMQGLGVKIFLPV